MSEPEAPQSDSPDANDLPDIKYENSSHFRVTHCDIDPGGRTPQRLFGMSLYAQLVKPPYRIVELDEQGDLKQWLIYTKREVIRHVEATVMLSLDQLETLGSWLRNEALQAKENG